MTRIAFSAPQQTRNDLNKSQRALNTAIERLSSGQRINGARDDAAGLAIADRMTAQIEGQQQATRNTNDGISMAQTAESALAGVNERLQRIRELTVQGLNGTLKLVDSDAIQQEINLNLKEIDRLVEQRQYNGFNLLDGSRGTVKVQVGANDGETLGIDLNPPGYSVEELGLKDFTVAGISGAVTPINMVYGSAYAIPVVDGSTELAFSRADLSDATLMDSTTSGYGDAYSPYYTRAVGDDGEYVYYQSKVTPSPSHKTASGRNEIDVQVGNRLYEPVDQFQGYPLETTDVRYLDTTATAFTNADTRLVKTGTHYFIQQGSGSDALYYKATVTTQKPVVATQAASGEAAWPPSPATAVEGESLATAQVDYVDAQGAPVVSAALTHVGDSYYLTTADANGERLYQGADVAWTASEPPRLSVTARDEPPTTAPQTQPVSMVDGQALDGADHRYLDAGGDSAAFAGATLTSDGEHYYLEVDGQYYLADTPSAEKRRVTVTATTASPLAAPSFTAVESVNGVSTITLDPRNVTANYTDQDGRRIDDALRIDSDGHYYLRASSGDDATPGYRSATLVESEELGTLLKTRTGSGDVIVYYQFTQAASTNVPADHSVVSLRELNGEIRLKTPDDPLAALDRAIARVDDKRSQLGATQNRMAAAIDQQYRSAADLIQARSRIMDADYAVEVSNLAVARILQQAGTSVLAQANQSSESVLTLLQQN